MTLEKLILLRRQTKAKINEINLQLSWTVSVRLEPLAHEPKQC